VFDSTDQRVRLIFGGLFLAIGLNIAWLILSFSSNVGYFECFFCRRLDNIRMFNKLIDA
jgi:hypothetical protein